MNVFRLLQCTAAVASVVGMIGIAQAQSNPNNINSAPNNRTQTQSDAALPCQPGPFNPHLPNAPKAKASATAPGTSDCPTGTYLRTPAKTVATTPNSPKQSDAVLPNQPAPFNPSLQTTPKP